MIAESAVVGGLLGAGVLVLLVLLALIVGWRRDKRTRSVEAGVFLRRELYTDTELDELGELGRRRLGLDPPEPEPPRRPDD